MDIIYSSPKPRLVDIEESPTSPDEPGSPKSPNHRVDVSVIGHSPHGTAAIVSAPAGDTKEDGEAARLAEEAAEKAAAANGGEGKLIDVTVTEERSAEGTPATGTGTASTSGSDRGDDGSDSTSKTPAAASEAPASTSTQGQGSRPKKKKKGKKKGGQ